MNAFILDCSMIMPWHFEDEATPGTDAVLARAREAVIHVPPLWFMEVANTLTLAERKGRFTRAKGEEFLAMLGLMDIREDRIPLAKLQPRIVDLAREEKLTAYDATYLELALREGMPLATLDKELIKAAKRRGVSLVGEKESPSPLAWEVREEAVGYGVGKKKKTAVRKGHAK